MSWSRSSRLGLAVLLLLALVAAVGVASAVSVTEEQAPEEAAPGDQVTVNVNLTDLFAQESSWEINGRTQLENAQWTIELYQGQDHITTYESSGEQPDSVPLEEGVTDADRVVVTITGTAPAPDEYSYEEPQTFLAGEVVQYMGSSEPPILSEQHVRHYTSESQDARTALDDANATIQSAAEGGADVSEARSTFQDAVSDYNGENFDEAVSLADEAASQAESADSGSDDGGSSDGGESTDGSTDGSGSDTGGSTSDGGQSDGSDSGGGNQSDADGGNGSDGADGGNASSSGGSDDGGLLMPILYGLLGLLILGAVGGGLYWYQQQNKGPSRDPLG